MRLVRVVPQWLKVARVFNLLFVRGIATFIHIVLVPIRVGIAVIGRLIHLVVTSTWRNQSAHRHLMVPLVAHLHALPLVYFSQTGQMSVASCSQCLAVPRKAQLLLLCLA